MRKKIVKVKQHDITDCGAACLSSIADHYGLKLPISRIRQLASTDQKGTNVLGMVEAAEKLGFQAKGVKGTLDSLSKIPKPAIAHVIVKDVLHHFVVIYEVNKKNVKYMDPADGSIHRSSHQEFKKIWTGVLILLLPSESFQGGDKKTSVKRRFWNLINPHKSIMFQAFIGAVLYTILGLSTSIYVQKIIDFVLIDGNKRLLNLLSISVIILLTFRILIGTSKSLFMLRTGQKIDAELILGYYKHLMTLPQKFFDTMRVGEIISRVNDAVKIRTFINDVALELVVNLLIIVFSFTLLAIYSWKIALLSFTILPVYASLYFITNQINKRYQRKIMEDAADLESHLVESLNAMSTIKRFGTEEFANLKTETRFVKLLKSIYKSGITSLFSGSSSEYFTNVFTIILLWVGSYFVIDKSLTPGELMSCYAIFGYLTSPMNVLIGSNRTIQDAVIAADRLFEIMDLEREKNENKIKLSGKDLGNIKFKDVFFRYGSRVTVFEKLSLEIEKGKFTAIVGESGCGKTTLISILQNIYPIEKGIITIGNYQLNNISNDTLRKMVAVVPQKIDLFSGNVVDNIAIGEFDPDMKRINDIATNLGLTEFIQNLPDGYNTYLGENGASLSGGQKQRLAIARALYKDPEVLILDEATSSLDSISEQFVQRTIDLLKKQGKTIIIIAHRLSTVMNADKIIVMEKGDVAEEGSHGELMATDSKYFNLWKQQIPMIGLLGDLSSKNSENENKIVKTDCKKSEAG